MTQGELEMKSNETLGAVRGAAVIDCRGLGKAELLAAFARELHFPDWFGGSLDALYDCLTDADVVPCAQIRLLNWKAADLTEDERMGFESVLEDAREERGDALQAFLA